MKRVQTMLCAIAALFSATALCDTYTGITTQTVVSVGSPTALQIETTWTFEDTVVDGVSGLKLISVSPTLYQKEQSIPDVILDEYGKAHTVIEYGDRVFADSPFLTKLTIANTVLKLGDFVFSNCTALTSVELGDNLRYLGKRPFVNTSVKEITLPDTLLNMDGNPAAGMPYDAKINISDSSHFCYSEDGLLILNKDMTRLYACATRAEGFVEIPSTVTEIMPDAFYGCFRLKCINVPASVTKIGSEAFNVSGNWKIHNAPESTPLLETVFYQGKVPSATDIYTGAPSTLVSYTFDQAWKDQLPTWQGRDLEINTGAFATDIFEAEYLGINWKFRIVSDNGISYYAEIWNNGKSAIPVTTDTSTEGSISYGYVSVPASLFGFPVQKIGTGAFAGCNVCNTIYLPSTVSVIDNSAFYDCSAVTRIYGDNDSDISIPDGVRSLGSRPFDGMSKVKSLYIPSSLKTLTGNPLAGCANVTEIEVSEANRYFVFEDPFLLSSDKSVLYACMPTATDITVSDTVTEIADYAFENCDVLKTITFLAPVEGNVPADTFKGLDKVSVKIDINTAEGWNNITNSAPWKALVDDERFITYGTLDPTGDAERSYTDETTGITWLYRVQSGYATITGLERNKANISELTLPTTINNYTVTKIGAYAFADIIEIESVIIPSYQYREIGDYAFMGCEYLVSINLNQIQKLGKAPFADTSLATLELPAKLQSVDGNPLIGCYWLEEITVAEKNRYFSTDEANLCLYNAKGTTLIGCCPDAEEITFRNTLKTIKPDAFADCKWLEAIYAESNAPTEADDHIFDDTPAELTIYVDAYTYDWGNPVPSHWKNAILSNTGDVAGGSTWTDSNGIGWKYEIADSVATILSAAKADGTPVTALTVPQIVSDKWPVKKIGASAFANLISLSYVTIPATCNVIGDYAFSNCTSLATISIPSGVRVLGKAPFYGTAITELSIPNTVNSIDGNPLAGCVYATSISVADDNPYYSAADGMLFNKSQSALIACIPSATEITIHSSVERIADDAFSGCSRLTKVTMLGDEPAANDNIFAGTPAELKVYGDGCDCRWSDAAQLVLKGWKKRKFIDTGKYDPVGIQTTADENGIQWSYTVSNHQITLGNGTSAISKNTSNKVAIPASLSVAGIGYLPVVAVGSGAFNGCANITEIEIPASITKIANDAFNGCTALERFTVASDNPSYRSDSTTGALYSKDGSALIKVPATFQFTVEIATTTTTVSGQKQKDVVYTTLNDKLDKRNATITYTPDGEVTTNIVSKTETIVADPNETDLLNGVSFIADFAFCDCGKQYDTKASEDVSETTEKTSNPSYPEKNNALHMRYTVVYTTVSTSSSYKVPFPTIPDTVSYTKQSFYGSAWYDSITKSDMIPALAANATSAEIASALDDADDKWLETNITDISAYNDFRNWASKIGQAEVMSSSSAWAAYALDLDQLPADEITASDFTVEKFELDGIPKSEILVSVKDVSIGAAAAKANLLKLITIEGGTSLEPGALSTDAISVDAQITRNGQLQMTITPAEPSSEQFFISIKVNLD